MKIKQMENMPTKAGYYFVKYKVSKKWENLVYICGCAPFLEMIAQTPIATSDTKIVRVTNDVIFSEEIDFTI